VDNGGRPGGGLLSGEAVEFLAKITGLSREGDAMSFGLYAIGFAIMIGGLMYGAHLMHMPAHWIAVGAIVLLGVGILTGVKATRQKDPVG
jgi:hypothetical protein